MHSIDQDEAAMTTGEGLRPRVRAAGAAVTVIGARATYGIGYGYESLILALALT